MRYKPFKGPFCAFYIGEDANNQRLQLPVKIGVPLFKEALFLVCYDRITISIKPKGNEEDLQYLVFDNRSEHRFFTKFIPGCPYYDVVVEGKDLAQKICGMINDMQRNRDEMVDLLYCFSDIAITPTEVKINLRENIRNYIGIKVDDLVEISNAFAYSFNTPEKVSEVKYKDKVYAYALDLGNGKLEVKFFVRTLRKIDDIITEKITIGTGRNIIGTYTFCKTPLSQQVEIIRKQE